MVRTLLSPRPLDAGVSKRVVTVLKMHLFTCVFQHMFQGLLIIRSHLQRVISRSHDCEKMFQVFQTLTFAAVQLDRSIRIGVLCQLTQ